MMPTLLCFSLDRFRHAACLQDSRRPRAQLEPTSREVNPMKQIQCPFVAVTFLAHPAPTKEAK